MTAPHLLRVDAGPDVFAPLVEAVRSLGLRVGWLELAPPPPLPSDLGDLEIAAGLGTLRAVAAGGGRAVVVKPLRGEPVLGDLLREHFRGCALVLVRGEAAAPLLQAAAEDRWNVTVPGEAARAFATTDLAEALRSPRPPWAPPPPPRPPRPPKKVKKTKQEKKRARVEKRKQRGKPERT